MPLGTLDRTPPPFFRQGPSALTKLAFFSALALFLMAADTRFAAVRTLRAALATALAPVERTLLVPVELWRGGAGYAVGLQRALAAEDAARAELARQSERATRAEALAQENARLRGLLELRARLTVRSQAAETRYEASDAYSRKVIIDRGSTHGVVAGSPVINEVGVLGQVTRVYPLAAEVTLLTDKDAAIPLAEDHLRVWSPASGAELAWGPVITWASRTKPRLLSSLAAAAALRHAPLRVLRIGVHPPDVRHPALVGSIGKTFTAALRRRSPGRYADLLA